MNSGKRLLGFSFFPRLHHILALSASVSGDNKVPIASIKLVNICTVFATDAIILLILFSAVNPPVTRDPLSLGYLTGVHN